jgi:hypothetical protein
MFIGTYCINLIPTHVPLKNLGNATHWLLLRLGTSRSLHVFQ